MCAHEDVCVCVWRSLFVGTMTSKYVCISEKHSRGLGACEGAFWNSNSNCEFSEPINMVKNDLQSIKSVKANLRPRIM